MHALVIGTGAVGAFLGAALEERGVLPAYIGRDGPTAFTARVSFPDGADRLVCRRAPTPAEVKASDIAFVAVKAFDLEAAFAALAPLRSGTPVIPLANGAVEPLVRAAAARWPELVLRVGYSTFGVSALAEPGSYALRSKTGEVAFGPLAGAGDATAAERRLLDRPGVFTWHQAARKAARRKWLFNVVINTLCAARGLARNGDLLADIPMLAAVFNEGWDLGEEVFGPWGLQKADTYKAMEALITATAGNENSMARDKRLGRRTEAAFLGGLARDVKKYPLLTSLVTAEAPSYTERQN